MTKSAENRFRRSRYRPFPQFSHAVALAVLAAILFAGCGRAMRAEDTGRQLVATVEMIGDILRAVAGDPFEVITLMGEGVDPHAYKPTRADVLALRAADAVFYNGFKLEGKMEEIFERLHRRGKPVYPVALLAVQDRGVALLADTEGEDPHLWMDVAAWVEVVSVVEAALSDLHPAYQLEFAQRAAALRERLMLLDSYVRELVASIPEPHRLLVTAHDAFAYFGRAYGIEVKGIQGVSTESEAGLRDLEDLVSLLVKRRIPAIFSESSVADKNVRALVEGSRARGHTLIMGGTLYSDAMGPSGTAAGTYIGMIEHNANTVVEALGGRVPAGGFNQWLEQVKLLP